MSGLVSLEEQNPGKGLGTLIAGGIAVFLWAFLFRWFALRLLGLGAGGL